MKKVQVNVSVLSISAKNLPVCARNSIKERKKERKREKERNRERDRERKRECERESV